jgi:plasmid stabilization system protein ParE
VKKFELSRRALGDLRDIWEFVSEDSFSAADRLLEEFLCLTSKKSAGYKSK